MKQRPKLKSLASEAGTIILDAQKPAKEGQSSLLFHSPERILSAWDSAEVLAVLREAETLAGNGEFVVAGFIAYEAAGAFDLTTRCGEHRTPLIWLGVYSSATRLRRTDWPAGDSRTECPMVSKGSFNVTGEEFIDSVERARGFIAAGDTYQVNLTCKYRFDLMGVDGQPVQGADGAFDYFLRLRRAHPVPYGAFLNLGEIQILSFSPELFLSRRGKRLTTRPMKGTGRRGRDCEEDNRLRRLLKGSEKDRAENVMIVDLMRNDLGRVCEIGSVRVPRLFDVERYDTVHQMTSTVEGDLKTGTGLVEILNAAFPCGSITGAPKRRTMEIISELEKETRGPYCGAIGWIKKGGDFSFSVGIRTIVHENGNCELGVGSGITWGSEARSEWDETQLKSTFVDATFEPFLLIETLLLEPTSVELEGARADHGVCGLRYALLDRHLRRMNRSARYWGYRFPRKRLVEALEQERQNWIEVARGERFSEGPAKRIVRITLDADGAVAVSSRPLDELPQQIAVAVWPEPQGSGNRLLYHKTDSRETYDRAKAITQEKGFAEVLFVNESGRITEGAITNIFAEIDGHWCTPPVSEGLLPGIWREEFRRSRRAVEQSLDLGDLRKATRVCIGNSVRGAIDVDSIRTLSADMNQDSLTLWTKPT